MKGVNDEHHKVQHKYKSLPNGDPITFSHIYFASMIQNQWRRRKHNFSNYKGTSVTNLWTMFEDMSNDQDDLQAHVKSYSKAIDSVYPSAESSNSSKFNVDPDIEKKLKSIIVNVDDFYVPDWVSSTKSSTSHSMDSKLSTPGKGILRSSSPQSFNSRKDLKLQISIEPDASDAPISSPVSSLSKSPKKSRSSTPASVDAKNTGWHL
jgi:hypothetical protein